MITKFLENLSYRVNNENALSDITWSMCNASPMFKETFLHFFFPDMNVFPDVEIEREISKDDSRPDFVIYNDDELYIIENKINDHNHHFGQYDKTFKVSPERFGYIANYVIPQPKDKQYQIRTWEEFYKLLGTIHSESEQEQSLIAGFQNYLKNVCNIIDFTKPMNIEGIYSLYQLMEVLNKLCNREEEMYTVKVYNQNRTYENCHGNHEVMGVNFEIIFRGIRLQSWGWIGIYFNDEIPLICMGFYDMENWGKTVCNLIRKNMTDSKVGKFTSEPYEEDDAYWFNFEDGKDTYEECFNKLSLDEQIGQIKTFMDEVFEFIYKLKDQ
jgi:hypothetical protein